MISQWAAGTRDIQMIVLNSQETAKLGYDYSIPHAWAKVDPELEKIPSILSAGRTDVHQVFSWANCCLIRRAPFSEEGLFICIDGANLVLISCNYTFRRDRTQHDNTVYMNEAIDMGTQMLMERLYDDKNGGELRREALVKNWESREPHGSLPIHEQIIDQMLYSWPAHEWPFTDKYYRPHVDPIFNAYKKLSDNLLISGDFLLKIGDFGTLKILEPAEKYPPIPVGTKNYMAPEYLNVAANPLSAEHFYKADVYGAGVVLWEMITRSEAPAATDDRVLAVGQHVPEALREVLSRCLEKDFKTRAISEEICRNIAEYGKISRRQFRPVSDSSKNYLTDPITALALNEAGKEETKNSWCRSVAGYDAPEVGPEKCLEFDAFLQKVKAKPDFDAWTIKKRLLVPLDHFVKFLAIPLDEAKDDWREDPNMFDAQEKEPIDIQYILRALTKELALLIHGNPTPERSAEEKDEAQKLIQNALSEMKKSRARRESAEDQGRISTPPGEMHPADIETMAKIRGHPMFPVLKLFTEKVESATYEMKSSVFKLTDVEALFVELEAQGASPRTEDLELDRLVWDAIYVMRLHLAELARVAKLAEDFRANFSASLKKRVNHETLIGVINESDEEASTSDGESNSRSSLRDHPANTTVAMMNTPHGTLSIPLTLPPINHHLSADSYNLGSPAGKRTRFDFDSVVSHGSSGFMERLGSSRDL
ncbi:unnamed protein product, partial [Mesorhabditis spiculigera]